MFRGALPCVDGRLRAGGPALGPWVTMGHGKGATFEESGTRPVIRRAEVRGQLIGEAGRRLIELGFATTEQLAEEPTMDAIDADEASAWVHVAFSWEPD